MDINDFTICFKDLCLSFDLDYESKKSRIGVYYDSKLGGFSKEKFLGLIKKARENLNIKPGYLPPINQLIELYYTENSNEVKIHSRFDLESGNYYKHELCGGTGKVTLIDKDGYEYGGFA